MNTTRLSTLILVFVLFAMSATAQSWRWAVSGGAGNASMVWSDREYIADMATDRNGNVYTRWRKSSAGRLVSTNSTRVCDPYSVDAA